MLCGVVCHLPLYVFGDAGGGCSMGVFVFVIHGEWMRCCRQPALGVTWY